MSRRRNQEAPPGLDKGTRAVFTVCALMAMGAIVFATVRIGQAREEKDRAAAAAAAAGENAAATATPVQHDHGSGKSTGTAGGGGAKKAMDLGVVSLDVCADGKTLHLLTARRDAAGAVPRLEYRSSTDDGGNWTSPVIVGDGQAPPGPVKRGADAQIVAKGDKLFAAWTTAGSLDRMGRGPIESSVSADGGRTWKPGPNPSDSGVAIGHAFLDLAADDQGTFHMVWLDGRDQPVPTTAPAAKKAKRDPSAPSPGKGLRYARSTDGGVTWSANRTLVEKTCECCWNTLAASRGHIRVMYRQHTPRDMAVIGSADGGDTWGEPVTVGAFGWDVQACPHVGGGLALRPDRAGAVATVWTARGAGATGAFYLGTFNGKSWSDPAQLGGSSASWRSDIAAGQGGALAIAYDAYVDNATAVFAVTSPDEGKTWSAARRLSASGTSATHPRVIRTASGFRAFWTSKPAADAPATWESTALTPSATAAANSR